MQAKTRQPRKRRYVSKSTLRLLAPLLRYSEGRQAYVLRLIGNWRGPVLKLDRRRRADSYGGPERRRVGSVRVALN